MSVYVYALLRPDSGDVFYIGMGRGDRAWHHQLDRKCGRSYKRPMRRHRQGYSGRFALRGTVTGTVAAKRVCGQRSPVTSRR